jgi:hypothetical protein
MDCNVNYNLKVTSILRRFVSPMAIGKMYRGSVCVKSLNHNIPPFISVSVDILSTEVILVIMSILFISDVEPIKVFSGIVNVSVHEFDFVDLVAESTICLKANELLMKSGICIQGNK